MEKLKKTKDRTLKEDKGKQRRHHAKSKKSKSSKRKTGKAKDKKMKKTVKKQRAKGKKSATKKIAGKDKMKKLDKKLLRLQEKKTKKVKTKESKIKQKARKMEKLKKTKDRTLKEDKGKQRRDNKGKQRRHHTKSKKSKSSKRKTGKIKDKKMKLISNIKKAAEELSSKIKPKLEVSGSHKGKIPVFHRNNTKQEIKLKSPKSKGQKDLDKNKGEKTEFVDENAIDSFEESPHLPFPSTKASKSRLKNDDVEDFQLAKVAFGKTAEGEPVIIKKSPKQRNITIIDSENEVTKEIATGHKKKHRRPKRSTNEIWRGSVNFNDIKGEKDLRLPLFKIPMTDGKTNASKRKRKNPKSNKSRKVKNSRKTRRKSMKTRKPKLKSSKNLKKMFSKKRKPSNNKARLHGKSKNEKKIETFSRVPVIYASQHRHRKNKHKKRDKVKEDPKYRNMVINMPTGKEEVNIHDGSTDSTQAGIMNDGSNNSSQDKVVDDVDDGGVVEKPATKVRHVIRKRPGVKTSREHRKLKKSYKDKNKDAPDMMHFFIESPKSHGKHQAPHRVSIHIPATILQQRSDPSRIKSEHGLHPQPEPEPQEQPQQQTQSKAPQQSQLQHEAQPHLPAPHKLGHSVMWTHWGPWSACSVTCGKNGYRHKNRYCMGSGDVTCLGPAEAKKACEFQPDCPVSSEIYLT